MPEPARVRFAHAISISFAVHAEWIAEWGRAPDVLGARFPRASIATHVTAPACRVTSICSSDAPALRAASAYMSITVCDSFLAT